MPKRNSEERIEKYLRKIEKIKRRRRLRTLSSSESEPENDLTTAEHETQPEVVPHTEEPDITLEEIVAITNTPNLTNEVPPETVRVNSEDTTSVIPDLDPSVLEALGEIVDDTPDFGEKIHDSLSKIWTPILKKGMTKDSREKILKEYFVPENCQLLKSPTLNPEILAAIPESGRFRDKKMAVSQQQLGLGITAINRGLNTLLTGDNKVGAIKYISDGCRLLSDLHFQNTETRKKFITPNLDKSFLQIIQVSDRDDTLYGNKLSEKIKASKAIVTQSQQIKKTTVTPKPSTSQSATRSTNQGNWQAPPRFPSNRGGRGGIRRNNPRIPPPTVPMTHTHPKTNQKTRGSFRQQHP